MNEILLQKRSYRHLKSICTQLYLVHSNNFAFLASEEQFTLENIFTEETYVEVDEFHVSKKCLGQSLTKHFQKKFSWISHVFQI